IGRCMPVCKRPRTRACRRISTTCLLCQCPSSDKPSPAARRGIPCTGCLGEGGVDEGAGGLLEVAVGGGGGVAEGGLDGEDCEPVHGGPDGVLDAGAALPGEDAGVGELVEGGAELVQGQGVLSGLAVLGVVGVLAGEGERGGEQAWLLAGEVQ